jgi:hypothetical protein
MTIEASDGFLEPGQNVCHRIYVFLCQEAVLRGAGVPEPFIVQMKALVAAMEPYSCFISYNHTDKSFARRVHDTL